MGNRKTWTWSAWAKMGSGTGLWTLLSCPAANNDNQYLTLYWNQTSSTGKLYFGVYSGNYRISTPLYRDPSGWYHFVFVLDTTQATANNRIRIYVNGVEVTAFSTLSNPTQNADLGINQASATYIGTENASANFLNGYLTEVYFIDGQALTPSSFGETDTDTGVWRPKAYSGTYGTNGFYLKFADNSNTTAATLGKDSSGNGNNWTPNNFSVTAGSGNDSLVDTPTSYGTDTGAGGEVRGNYCTLNSVNRNNDGYVPTMSNGNLEAATAGQPTHIWGTMAVPSSTGSWYWEGVCTSMDNVRTFIGIVDPATSSASGLASYSFTDKAILARTGLYYNLASGTAGGNSGNYTSYAQNDVVMVAYSNGKIWFGKNGTWMNSGNPAAGTGAIDTGVSTSKTWLPYFGYNSNWTANFGQRPFAYTAPSGFKALCTQNLSTPTIGATTSTRANKHFDVTTYTGNGTNNRVITTNLNEVGLAWVKIRSSADDHRLANIVTGGNKHLKSNNTGPESTATTIIQAFSGSTFTVGVDNSVNVNGSTYVAWTWAANGAGSTNNAGSIQSTVSASTLSGFSIVTYTGTGANATVGHGLGVAPKMVIVKQRGTTVTDHGWRTYHAAVGATKYLALSQTDPAYVFGDWNNTAPTSTVFSIGSTSPQTTAGNGATYVAYCFAEIPGYSKFDSYTGNGNADGPFVYTGFRPAYVLIKRSSDGTNNWEVRDIARDTYNTADDRLFPNTSAAEDSNNEGVDFLSNGFKIRNSGSGSNASGATYIYMALAQNPFKYSLAR